MKTKTNLKAGYAAGQTLSIAQPVLVAPKPRLL